MSALIIFLVFTFVIFCLVGWIFAIIEIAKASFKEDVIKVVWLLFTVFMPFIGSICWFFIGRNMRTYPTVERSYSATASPFDNDYKQSDLV